MTKLDDGYHGRFTAILPTGSRPAPEPPVEEAPRKGREPRTRFTCLLPVAPEGFQVPVYRRGKCRQAKV